ncbi:histidine kinase [Paenibacillus tritici]|uniref:Histidine kinase n=1 Tax=Paenibacillus tritici TaxID=1873425 RepID=A0ABX2DQA5_9BACL|nr:histidine kinase [Paenibacillus tritici]NQX45794.1 histidine kinase [Paenibacillus tritici]
MSDVILQQILAELQGMKSEITDIKSDVKNLHSEFNTFKSEIVAELVTIKADIESIKEDTRLIPLIQQAVSEVNAEVVANRVTLERIDRTLRGHDATLDVLARRSIDQEAELKRLASSA